MSQQYVWGIKINLINRMNQHKSLNDFKVWKVPRRYILVPDHLTSTLCYVLLWGSELLRGGWGDSLYWD